MAINKNSFIPILIPILILILILITLPSLALAQYQSVGTDSTIDIMAWNIENFPKDGANTVSEVATIISTLDADLIGVEEIASVPDFNALLGQLSGWDGILSSHEYSSGEYQKVGLLFRSDKVTVSGHQLLFEDDTWAFPRPPMEFFLSVTEGGYFFDLRLIVLHLKAYGDETSESRRRAAIESLKTYIDDEVLNGPEDDFVILGDYNDHLEDPPEDNVFAAMLDAPDDYVFLTWPLAGTQGSYIGLYEPNLIDHICITTDAETEYGVNGNTEVLYLDHQNSSYEAEVSDHRPVFAQFAFDNGSSVPITAIKDIHDNFSSYNGQTVTIRGVVTIGSGILSTTFTSAYVQDDSDAGIYIYLSGQVVSGLEQGNRVELTGRVLSYNGLHEIQYQSHQILNINEPLPEPVLISTASINDVVTNPGRWISVTGAIESISDGPHINMMINDGSGAGNIYFDPDAGLDVSMFSVGESIKVTGVKTVYNHSGQVQPGYQGNIEEVISAMADDLTVKPVIVELSQNYPNPFNPKTTIRYSVRANNYSPLQVELSIYDILGQKVATLVSETKPAGNYMVQWDASGFPGGVYYYQLKTNALIEVKRMLLIR